MHKNLLYFLLIFGLAIVLFTYKLGSIPNGVYSDEAVVGYNAWSILTTGNDENGEKLPILFKFFGTYTPGLMVYLQIIPVNLFGLNAWSIRLLSVIFMLILVGVIYKYFGKLAAWLMVISPWVIFNARLGYETTVAMVLMVIGAMMSANPVISFGLLSLSTYASFTSRYLAPMIIGLIIFIFYFNKKSLIKIKWAIILAFIIQIPNLLLINTPEFWSKNNSLTTNLLSQYISYFSPANLFNRPDFDLQRSIPQMAVFYGWMFVPWIVGWYVIYKNRKNKFYQYLMGLIILSPIPAALSNTNYSTQRALPLLFFYTILIYLGMKKILAKFGGKTKILVVFGLSIFSLLMLWRSYFVLFPVEREYIWGGGYEQLAKFIKENSKEHFVVDSGRGMPYANLEFYLQTNKTVNVEIRPIDWRNDICKRQILVGDNLAISEDQIKEHFLTKVFDKKDGRNVILLQGYETNPKLKCGIETKGKR